MMKQAFLQIFFVSAFTFASTNTDNLIIYTGFVSSKQGSKASMVMAYFIAMFILLTVIYALSLFFSRIPNADVKYVGLVLFLAGATLLTVHFLKKDKPTHHPHYSTASPEWMLGITMLMDSFDTMSVFVPLFADSNKLGDTAVASSFVCCFVVWGLAGLYISKLTLFKFLTRHKDVITPIIVMLVGLYIFMNTAADVE